MAIFSRAKLRIRLSHRPIRAGLDSVGIKSSTPSGRTLLLGRLPCGAGRRRNHGVAAGSDTIITLSRKGAKKGRDASSVSLGFKGATLTLRFLKRRSNALRQSGSVWTLSGTPLLGRLPCGADRRRHHGVAAGSNTIITLSRNAATKGRDALSVSRGSRAQP